MDLLNTWFSYLQDGIASGLLVTLETMVVACLVTVVWGLLVNLLRISPIKPLRFIAIAYIELFRGTPLLVQMLIIYATLPIATGIMLPAFQTAILTIMLNQGTYMAECYRSGFESVPVGQREAAAALGMSPIVEFWRIQLPLAIRVILPAIGNRALAMLLTTPFVFMVGVVEMMAQANKILGETGDFSVFVLITIIYVLVGMTLNIANSRFERALRTERL